MSRPAGANDGAAFVGDQPKAVAATLSQRLLRTLARNAG
jgi:hypothetical protein